MSDRIFLKNIQCYCKLGIYDEERVHGQCVNVDLELELDLSVAGASDDVADTISYVDVSLAVQELVMARPYNLIEHLCTELSSVLLAKFSKLNAVTVEIHKPVINAKWFQGDASVRIRRARA